MPQMKHPKHSAGIVSTGGPTAGANGASEPSDATGPGHRAAEPGYLVVVRCRRRREAGRAGDDWRAARMRARSCSAVSNSRPSFAASSASVSTSSPRKARVEKPRAAKSAHKILESHRDDVLYRCGSSAGIAPPG
jgi:hypothetical protein